MWNREFSERSKTQKGFNSRSMRYIGKRNYFNAIELSSEYERICDENERAAALLRRNGFYNESAYLYAQAMEKRVKSCICGKLNMSIPVFAQKMKDVGHSLDESVKLLIEIFAAGNAALKDQLTQQILTGVFEGQRFEYLNNTLRYPFYDSNKADYSMLQVTDADCERISVMNMKLKKFIQDLNRL